MSLLESLVAAISPSICLGCGAEGTALCVTCTPVGLKPFGSRCYACSRLSPGSETCRSCTRFGGPAHVWISEMYGGTAERLIELYKYGSHRPAGQVLAHKMADNLTVQTLPADCLLVPIPTATARVRERGFDHIALLTKLIAKQTGLEYSPALRRLGRTRQVGAARRQRLSQAMEGYRLAKPGQIKRRHIILVDDVVTTGATLQATAKLLRRGGARRVDALVFARKQ